MSFLLILLFVLISFFIFYFCTRTHTHTYARTQHSLLAGGTYRLAAHNPERQSTNLRRQMRHSGHGCILWWYRWWQERSSRCRRGGHSDSSRCHRVVAGCGRWRRYQSSVACAIAAAANAADDDAAAAAAAKICCTVGTIVRCGAVCPMLQCACIIAAI